MRRLPFLATVLLLAASLPASAQMRGGGRGSVGGHGGFAAHGSFGGQMGGGHAFGGMASGRSFSGQSLRSRGFSHGPSFRQPEFFRGDRFLDRRFRNFGFGNCFGCRPSWGWPWWYAGYYDPYWWWDSHSSNDEEHEREIRLANERDWRSLEEQRMRREEEVDSYARSDPPPARQAENREAPAPATVLVFRDQHKQEVQNYAIVGQTLWTFAPQRTQKILVSDLDIPSTVKANDERGVEFRVPGFSEGQ